MIPQICHILALDVQLLILIFKSQSGNAWHTSSLLISLIVKNFKNKRNIAIEKSDIFIKKYNPLAEILYFQKKSIEEDLIYKIAKKEKLKKLIKIGNKEDGCYIIKVQKLQSHYYITLKIFNKNYKIILKEYED